MLCKKKLKKLGVGVVILVAVNMETVNLSLFVFGNVLKMSLLTTIFFTISDPQ